MDLILCHTTADFDTLGAAVGLTRLQPGARIVLAGGAHPAVRDFLALHRDEYALIERRSVTPEQIRSLTVVDTQRRDRLGKVAEWLDLPGVEITIYDHHPDAESDIPAAQIAIEAIGSTTTRIVEKLQAAGLQPTPVEATVMALGIHVDTGSLTFDHTTVRDAKALAWLMEQGANLRAIATYLDPGLSPPLQELLSIALDTLQTESVQGYTVAAVLLELEEFTPGLSSVAAQLMELTEIDALLLAAQYRRSGKTGGASHLGQSIGSDSTGSTSTVSPTFLTVIGRSRIEGTDLNQLFKPLGGGGHPRAASMNLALDLQTGDAVAALERLRTQLNAQIPRPPVARELMSSPVRTIRPETTIDEAQRILLRYGHSGLSIVDANAQLVGVISRRDLDIALHHGFSHAPVKGYMTPTLKTITPDTPLPEIEALMVTYDIGRLPVLDKGQLVGIVTRTDVLRQLHRGDLGHRNSPETPASPAPRSPSLLAALQQCLRNELWQVLMQAAEQAEARGWQLYLVGGAVRDLLLGLAGQGGQSCGNLLLEDVDLVVDGVYRSHSPENQTTENQPTDAPYATLAVGAGVELARSLQTLYPQSRLEIHGKFQTAALLWHNDPDLKSLWVDIATARTEFYPYPAANPEVEASSIRQDLYRRDFTINALAIRLTQPRSGELLDFFGGGLDLQAKQIRVLHANSFIEDPTRIYRAVRFATRLGFQIHPQTEDYIRHAIASGIYYQLQDQRDPRFRASTPALQTRLRAELKLLLGASHWKPALKKLGDLNALQCLHPSLTLDRALWQQVKRLDRWLTASRPDFHPPAADSHWLLRLEVLLARLAPELRRVVAENLQLPADSLDRLQALASAEASISSELPKCARPSQVVQVLHRYDRWLLGLLALRLERSLRKPIWRYLTQWSQVKPPLDGNDLKALGYKPGPRFKQILEALTAATLDGEICDRAAAAAFLNQQFPQAH